MRPTIRAKNSRDRLGVLPPAGQSAGDGAEYDADGYEDQNLRPEMGNGFVTPEDLGEAVDGPGVDGEQTGFLHGFGHEITGEHASANGGHEEDDEGRKWAELSASAADAGEYEAEGAHGKGGREAHDDEAGDMRGQIDFEYQPCPEKHEDQLGEGQQGAVAELAGQERSHGDA